MAGASQRGEVARQEGVASTQGRGAGPQEGYSPDRISTFWVSHSL